MTREEAQAFFTRRQTAWKNCDVDALTRDHAEDGTVSSPMLGTIQGREEIATSYVSVFRAFSVIDFMWEPLLIDGDRIAQPFNSAVTHTGVFMGFAGTGRRAQVQGVFFCDIANGMIAHEQRLYDFTSLLIQLGALRAKPAS